MEISRHQLITWRAALWLETKGMKRHGRSVHSIVKEAFGFRGTKQKVFAQLDELCVEMGIQPFPQPQPQKEQSNA